MSIPCFLVEECDDVELELRRYCNSDVSKCVGKMQYHDSTVFIGRAKSIHNEEGYLEALPLPPKDDARWKNVCDACDYAFSDEDYWQINQQTLYRSVNPDICDGEWQLQDLPAGAMLYPSWLQEKHGYSDSVNAPSCPRRWYHGPDNKCLMVVTPGGHWIVDSRCSNCTMPEDNEHACWVRHGIAPKITVDKNGLTCGAGAGSIQCGNYHGFLRDGFLVQA